ncbi:MAG: glycosyltransferase family 2 protein [Candidatus Methanomethyliaceae archaeon]
MIWILLPSYNEGARLEKTVERIWQSLPEDKKIVVVDDGSTLPPVNIDIDGVEVIKHGVNMGLAMALLTGFRRIVATAKDEDLLVTMDADNTMDPEVITDMVTAVDEGAKLVIASRYVRGARVQGVPPWRKLLSRIASWVAGKIIAVPGVKDYSSGFRAYRVDALRAALEVWGADFLSSSRGFEAQIS